MKRLIMLVCLLAVTSLACASQVDPAPASVSKEIHVYTSTPARVMSICLTAETVRLRMGAGTGYGEIALLAAGDKVKVTGEIAQSDDGGLWTGVQFEGLSGFVNSRYICE